MPVLHVDSASLSSAQITGSLFGTSSFAVTASYALTAGVAGSGTTFVGSTNVNDRIVTATGTTPELNGEANLSFNGSTLNLTGSLVVAPGGVVELRVTGSGVTIGNATTDIHQVTGSLRVNGGITGSLLGTASVATVAQSGSINSVSTAGSFYPIFVQNTSGNQSFDTNTNLSYNPGDQQLLSKKIRASDQLDISRALLIKRGLATTTAGTYVVDGADYHILLDTSGGACDVDLRNIENADNDGRVLVIKDAVGNAATNVITFTTLYNIDGGAGYTLDENYEAVTIVYDHGLSTWWVVSKFVP